MSWTSPFTVANTPTGHFAPDEADFEASITGIRTATARFITRAVFTTCGRNILPAPNSSPVFRMPSMSGPSTIVIGSGYAASASAMSASTKESSPRTREAAMRSASGSERHSGAVSASGFEVAPALFMDAASSRRRSPAPGEVLSTTASTVSRRSAGSMS